MTKLQDDIRALNDAAHAEPNANRRSILLLSGSPAVLAQVKAEAIAGGVDPIRLRGIDLLSELLTAHVAELILQADLASQPEEPAKDSEPAAPVEQPQEPEAPAPEAPADNKDEPTNFETDPPPDATE